jgi:glycosyltransferase involved in cell wall biosynthesis
MSITRRTRVARVVTRLNIGGPSWHVILLATRLGPEFETVLLVGETDAREGSMLGDAEAAGATVIRVPGLRRKPALAGDLRAALWLYRYFRSWRPVIVASHMAKAGTLARLAGFLARVPVRVHTFHGHVLDGYFGRAKTWVYLSLERLLGIVTSRFIAISPGLAADLRGMGIGAGKTSVIPLGLDLEKLRELPARGAFRADLGVGAGVILVGIVGRLVPIKAHGLFLEMAADVRSRRADVEFAIVGDGELWSSLQHQAAALGLGGSVHFAGWRRDLPEVYRDLDLLVCCSINEGTPVSVIEACAAGIPVVGTAVGGMGDVISPGETGLLVPSGDRAALTDAVLSVLDNPAWAAEMSAAARVRVTSKYSAARLVEDIRRLYFELAPGSSQASASPRDAVNSSTPGS